MADQPLTMTLLTEFYRELIAPDFLKVFARLDDIDGRFHDVNAHFDDVYRRFDLLEIDYVAITAGLARVEERLERMDERFDALERHYRDLAGATDRLEQRLSRLESQLDAAAAREKDPLRAEVAGLRARVEVLHLQVRNLEKRLDR